MSHLTTVYTFQTVFNQYNSLRKCSLYIFAIFISGFEFYLQCRLNDMYCMIQLPFIFLIY